MSEASDGDFNSELWGRRCLDFGRAAAKALCEAHTDEAMASAAEAFLWKEAPLAARLVGRLVGLDFLARSACAELHGADRSAQTIAAVLESFARRANAVWIEPKLPGQFLDQAFWIKPFAISETRPATTSSH